MSLHIGVLPNRLPTTRKSASNVPFASPCSLATGSKAKRLATVPSLEL